MLDDKLPLEIQETIQTLNDQIRTAARRGTTVKVLVTEDETHRPMTTSVITAWIA